MFFSPLTVFEALHHALPVGARLLLVTASCVACDDPSPEGLGFDVARELRDLPLAPELVEHASRGLGPDPPPPVASQDEELADVPRSLAREVGAVTDQHEAREGTVYPDEERCHPRVGPEALDRRGVAVEAVVANGPVVDGGEVVEVELHETSQHRELLRTRLAKLDLAAKEIPRDVKLRYFGPKDAPTVIVSWGSTKGALLDALDRLWAEGAKVGYLHVRLINPFPTAEIVAHLAKAKRRIGIEMNFGAQLAGIVREHTGVEMTHFIVKYNGRPMSNTELYDAIRSASRGKAEKRTVLTRGA